MVYLFFFKVIRYLTGSHVQVWKSPLMIYGIKKQDRTASIHACDRKMLIIDYTVFVHILLGCLLYFHVAFKCSWSCNYLCSDSSCFVPRPPDLFWFIFVLFIFKKPLDFTFFCQGMQCIMAFESSFKTTFVYLVTAQCVFLYEYIYVFLCVLLFPVLLVSSKSL